jgi:uncharacterized tellurite resistance protein B-like protein
MSISILYQSEAHKNNVAHFAALANMAIVDGQFNQAEQDLLKRFAQKLEITDSEYAIILKNPSGYPINPPSGKEERLQYLHDLFKMIFTDHHIDDEERSLIRKYAHGLGFAPDKTNMIIDKSLSLFNGNIDFEDYQMIINKNL